MKGIEGRDARQLVYSSDAKARCGGMVIHLEI